MPQAPSFENILVTGGTGFIGQALLRGLLAGGHRPGAIAHRSSSLRELPDDLKQQVSWVELDLLDHAAVRKFIDQARPTLVFHLAGVREHSRVLTQSAAVACAETNVSATLNLLDAATRAGAARIVITGSAEEYGDQRGPFDETSELRPVSIYGISKAAATRLARAMNATENCPVVIVRPFTVYGPGQPGKMFVAAAVECAVCETEFRMTAGEQRRDLVYIIDVVRALISAARVPGIEGKSFNIGSGRPIPLREVAQLIWRLSETNAQLSIGARAARTEELFDTWADIKAAREQLDWEPRVDLETGLRATIEGARKALDVWAGVGRRP